MLALIWGVCMAFLKACGCALAAYIFYWRVWDYYRACSFYGKQGRNVCNFGWNTMPVIGDMLTVIWSGWKSQKDGDNYFIMKHGFDYITKDTSIGVAFISNGAGLAIGDVKVVEAMYTTKNKYFDKHPLIKDLSYCLTGDSILFAETSDDWRKSRNAMSPAFYKGKLESLVEIAKFAVQNTVDRFKKIAAQGPRS